VIAARRRASAAARPIATRLPVALLLAVTALGSCRRPAAEPDDAAPAGGAFAFDAARASYVGRAACAECHAREDALLRGTDHERAMQEATPATVLGDFSPSTFTKDGVTTTFFRRDGRYMTRTDGPDGRPAEYEIAYVFGVDPLQQYLARFGNGRLQALPIAWDTRPRAAGGQRWFHLYPLETIKAGDPLHWTGRFQNWNHMCAECHLTNPRKGYDAATGAFATTWSEIGVSCEACHGPGSLHADWARQLRTTPGLARPAALGLAAALGDDDGGFWLMDSATGQAHRTLPRRSRAEVETCARCHARRFTLSEDVLPGRPLLDTHRPALLTPLLYQADGQILDEVFEYGSFLQSPMYAKGVSCRDCHDPHSQAPIALGSAVCATCHLPARFDTPAHHHHAAEAPGSRCIDCHMPRRLYMVVDGRRDHGFRVPRPDLAAATGATNACNDCHADRSADWAARAIAGWTNGRPRPAHFGEVLAAGRRHLAGAPARLVALAQDTGQPDIVRATAIDLMAEQPTPAALRAAAAATTDPGPLVRLAAVQTLEAVSPDERIGTLAPRLSDPVRGVRVEAARLLATAPAAALGPAAAAARDAALAEYVAAQALVADRPEGALNMAVLAAERGDAAGAERLYREALRQAPEVAAIYVNLADLCREQGRDEEGERLLRDGLLRAQPEADLHQALGLVLVRRGRPEEALPELRLAATLDPGQPRYAFVYAVALRDAGRDVEAARVLAKARTLHPGDRDLLFTLALTLRDLGRVDAARAAARDLAAAFPDDPEAARLAAGM